MAQVRRRAHATARAERTRARTSGTSSDAARFTDSMGGMFHGHGSVGIKGLATKGGGGPFS